MSDDKKPRPMLVGTMCLGDSHRWVDKDGVEHHKIWWYDDDGKVQRSECCPHGEAEDAK